MPAAKVILTAFVELVIFGLILFFSAGTFAWTAAWVYLGTMVAASAFLIPWVFTHNPGLFKERFDYFRPDQKDWDKVWVIVTGIVVLAWLVLMPLDAVRFHWSHLPVLLKRAGLAIVILDWYFIFVVFRANPFLASTVHVQEERGQTVISTGPYHYVRHPLYSAAFIYFFGTALLLGSWLGVLFEVIFFVMFGVRAVLEERQLGEQLKGYSEYLEKVRYRFIPYVW
jgi:protein-S-isoprenylcysteine O-methyltransferase Ste14